MADRFQLYTNVSILALMTMIIYFNVQNSFNFDPARRAVRCTNDINIAFTDSKFDFEDASTQKLRTPVTTGNNAGNHGNATLRSAFLSNQLVCPRARRPPSSAICHVETTWQLQDNPRGQIYLYSAYYDDRPLASVVPTVKVLTMSSFYQDISGYCHVWYESEEQPYVVKASVNQTSVSFYIERNRSWREFIYTCQLAMARPIPTYVSLTTDQCEPYTAMIPIGYEYHAKPLFNFGLCCANGHGSFNAAEMVEWFELNMMLGVAEINLYDTMYRNLTEVFDYYKKTGALKLYGLVHPLGMENGSWYGKVRGLRTISFNDCMMRNMYRYKWLVVIDHDENIIPWKANNLLDLLKEADRKLNLTYKLYSYTFLNEYFFREFPEDKKKPAYLKTLRLRHRANYSGWYVGSKSIVSPMFCFNLFNHYCWTRLPLYKGVVTKFVVPPMAASHHYRKCGKFYGTGPCEKLYQQKTLDNVMLRFEKNLTARVVPVLKKLGIKLS